MNSVLAFPSKVLQEPGSLADQEFTRGQPVHGFVTGDEVATIGRGSGKGDASSEQSQQLSAFSAAARPNPVFFQASSRDSSDAHPPGPMATDGTAHGVFTDLEARNEKDRPPESPAGSFLQSGSASLQPPGTKARSRHGGKRRSRSQLRMSSELDVYPLTCCYPLRC